MTRILLLENKTLPLRRLRIESRRSGVPFLYEYATSVAGLTHLLAQQPSAIVSMLEGMNGMPASEIAQLARKAGVPLFLVGGDTPEERSKLEELSGLIAGSCRRARVPWLPMLLERAVREFHGTEKRSSDPATATAHLHAAAEQMREVQKMAIIGRLAGSVVHEINNPLESITNLAYLLSLDEQMPQHLRGYVELLEKELGRVIQISKQTLSFYRETQTPVRVELSSLLEEVTILYARRLREKQIDLVRRYESEESVLLFPGEMRQVYANLLANAIEATEVGGRIVLRVRRARRSSSRDGVVEGVRVLVADSGSGIDTEVRRKLGQPFFTTKGQRGTGLGLWVSQAIVRRYHGEMQLRSSTDPARHGTTFGIFLPINLGPHKVEAALPSQMAPATPETLMPAGGLRVCASSE